MKRLTAVLNPLAIALATATVVAAPAVARPADRIDRFPGNGANVTRIPTSRPTSSRRTSPTRGPSSPWPRRSRPPAPTPATTTERS